MATTSSVITWDNDTVWKIPDVLTSMVNNLNAVGGVANSWNNRFWYSDVDIYNNSSTGQTSCVPSKALTWPTAAALKTIIPSFSTKASDRVAGNGRARAVYDGATVLLGHNETYRQQTNYNPNPTITYTLTVYPPGQQTGLTSQNAFVRVTRPSSDKGVWTTFFSTPDSSVFNSNVAGADKANLPGVFTLFSIPDRSAILAQTGAVTSRTFLSADPDYVATYATYPIFRSVRRNNMTNNIDPVPLTAPVQFTWPVGSQAAYYYYQESTQLFQIQYDDTSDAAKAMIAGDAFRINNCFRIKHNSNGGLFLNSYSNVNNALHFNGTQATQKVGSLFGFVFDTQQNIVGVCPWELVPATSDPSNYKLGMARGTTFINPPDGTPASQVDNNNTTVNRDLYCLVSTTTSTTTTAADIFFMLVEKNQYAFLLQNNFDFGSCCVASQATTLQQRICTDNGLYQESSTPDDNNLCSVFMPNTYCIIGDNPVSQSCMTYCAKGKGNCDTVYTNYCSTRLPQPYSSKDTTTTNLINQACGCFFPAKVYADFAKAVQVYVSLPQNGPNKCSYPLCAVASVPKFIDRDADCPPNAVSVCVQSIEFTNNGVINGNPVISNNAVCDVTISSIDKNGSGTINGSGTKTSTGTGTGTSTVLIPQLPTTLLGLDQKTYLSLSGVLLLLILLVSLGLFFRSQRRARSHTSSNNTGDDNDADDADEAEEDNNNNNNDNNHDDVKQVTDSIEK